MIHYCTYFDSNYLTRAVAMHASLVRHSPSFTLWALCLDDAAFDVVAALDVASLRPIRLSDLEAADPGLLAAKADRSTIEYYFTLTPFLPAYCFDASHRPLQGTPADAPFHFPDPALPLS